MSAKYTKEVLQEAVDASYSYAGVLRHLGLKQAGGTQSHIKRRINQLGLDTSHFTKQAWNRGNRDPKRKSWEEILTINPPGSFRTKVFQLRRAMLEYGIKYECSVCGLGNKWNGLDITLEVDHINREWLDNRPENVRFLCPNCHSQQ